MKRTANLALVLAAATLLSGCPFESEVAPGSPGPGSLDPQLKGRWIAGTLYHRFLEIDCIPFNGNEYLVEVRPEGKEVERYRVWTVRVGSEPFLVVSEVKDEKGKRPFYLARYSIGRDGALTIRFVGEKAVPKVLATDPKGLESYLAAHLEGPFLDDTEPPSVLRRDPPPGAGEAKSTP